MYVAPLQKIHPDEGDLFTGTRVCRKCLLRQSIDQFHFAGGKKYRRRICKACTNTMHQVCVAAKPELYRKLSRDWHLLTKYNMTEEEFWRMLLDQEGRCALCLLPLPQEVSLIHIDHNHRTDKKRGLLHQKCNNGLGLFDDSPERLRLAASYLEDDDDS
jgi:hypothetical protein